MVVDSDLTRSQSLQPHRPFSEFGFVLANWTSLVTPIETMTELFLLCPP